MQLGSVCKKGQYFKVFPHCVQDHLLQTRPEIQTLHMSLNILLLYEGWNSKTEGPLHMYYVVLDKNKEC